MEHPPIPSVGTMRVDVQGPAPLCVITCGHDEWRPGRLAATSSVAPRSHGCARAAGGHQGGQQHGRNGRLRRLIAEPVIPQASEPGGRQRLHRPPGKAQAEGVELLGPDGLLSQVTKAVLERVGTTSG
jgi:hypothetical protein